MSGMDVRADYRLDPSPRGGDISESVLLTTTVAGWLARLPLDMSSPVWAWRPFPSVALDVFERVYGPEACVVFVRPLDHVYYRQCWFRGLLAWHPGFNPRLHWREPAMTESEWSFRLPGAQDGLQGPKFRLFTIICRWMAAEIVRDILHKMGIHDLSVTVSFDVVSLNQYSDGGFPLGRTGSYARYPDGSTSCKIIMSPYVLNDQPFREFRLVLAHEVCHAIAWWQFARLGLGGRDEEAWHAEAEQYGGHTRAFWAACKDLMRLDPTYDLSHDVSFCQALHEGRRNVVVNRPPPASMLACKPGEQAYQCHWCGRTACSVTRPTCPVDGVLMDPVRVTMVPALSGPVHFVSGSQVLAKGPTAPTMEPGKHEGTWGAPTFELFGTAGQVAAVETDDMWDTTELYDMYPVDRELLVPVHEDLAGMRSVMYREQNIIQPFSTDDVYGKQAGPPSYDYTGMWA